jgi:hypothetical protein
MSDLADPSSNYSSWAKEQVARCPHFEMLGITTSWFEADNTKLWYILHSMFKGSLSYTHMKAFASDKDGRAAYLALKDYHLGTSHTQNISRNKAEALLSKLRYTGESKRYNFQKYATQHKECHIVLNNLKEHGYSGIDEFTKVRRLMDGIHYKPLETCKTQIFAMAALRVDFDGCVDLINNMIYSQNLGSLSRVHRLLLRWQASLVLGTHKAIPQVGRRRLLSPGVRNQALLPLHGNRYRWKTSTIPLKNMLKWIQIRSSLSSSFAKRRLAEGIQGIRARNVDSLRGHKSMMNGPRRLRTARPSLPSRLKASRRRNIRCCEESLWTLTRWTQNDSRLPLSP